jgi:glycosyltransferase 2 family protein
MKRLLKVAGFMLRLIIGLGIVAYLLYRINTHTSCIDFDLPGPVSVASGSTYADNSNATRIFVVLEDMQDGTLLQTVQRKGTARLTRTGTLRLISGRGDTSLQWSSWKVSQSGLGFLWDIIRRTLKHWPLLAAGFFLFFVDIGIIAVRWKLILDTQLLKISWKKVFSISFIGAFFNSFMPGALGGDIIRGYYSSRESESGRTELFLSAFIDRMLGAPSLILLPLLAMAIHPGLTFSNSTTRTMFFVLILVIVIIVGLFPLFFRRDLFDKFGFLRKLEQKASIGAIIRRAYDAIRLCLTHPALVTKGFLLSALGQLIGVIGAFCFIRALGEEVPFLDFLPLFLVAMFVAGIPVTPGGLGLREGAMVLFMSAADIPAVTALALSLLVYLGTLACGALGALVFICFPGPQGRGPTVGAQDPLRP